MKTIPRERLDRVEQLYLTGHGDREIERVVAKQFEVTERAVRRYLARVKAKLAAQAQAADPDAERARIQALLLNAYRVAEVGGEKGPNPQAMVAAAHRLAEVQGVLAPKKIEHSGSLVTDPDGLLRRVQEAAARRGRQADAPAVPGTSPGGPGGDRGGPGGGGG